MFHNDVNSLKRTRLLLSRLVLKINVVL